MAEYLKLLEHALPPAARDALAVFARYVRGEAKAKDLTSARVRCWQAADAIADSTDLSRKETCALRAAVCSLHEEPQRCEDLADVVDWFLMLANRVEDHASQAEPLLRRFLVET
jgi:hypothetical protein